MISKSDDHFLISTFLVARYVITNSSDWSISVGYIVSVRMHTRSQTFTSGNISEANQNVVSKVQQVRYWIPHSCILHLFVVLHSASPRAKPQTRAIYGRIMHSYVSNILYLLPVSYFFIPGFITTPYHVPRGGWTRVIKDHV